MEQNYKKNNKFLYLCSKIMIEDKNKLSDHCFGTLYDRLVKGAFLKHEEWRSLLTLQDEDKLEFLRKEAVRITEERFGKGIFIRGLIEISSYCRNNCYYCGLRCSNKNAERYRLSEETILSCCKVGKDLGFSTFVLQGGEDPIQTDYWLAGVVRAIKTAFPDCAVTLSVGERTEEAYRLFKSAGADRYLLRHETANDRHYACLHPSQMSLSYRKSCLHTLKKSGFQTGAGMMIGSPEQTVDYLVEDMIFMDELQPEMIGMGPFIPAAHTPFADCKPGSVEQTLRMITLVRLRFPDALIPATTALATLDQHGRERAILAGANVIMPNLSPRDTRKSYSIYDHKACTGGESAEALNLIEQQLARIGYHISYGRGDYKKREK